MRMDVRRRHPDAPLPARGDPGDAGLDLRAPVRLDPGERAAVRIGIALEMPAGHAGWVLPRSGLALRRVIALVRGRPSAWWLLHKGGSVRRD